jgi:hypothetical protein
VPVAAAYHRRPFSYIGFGDHRAPPQNDLGSAAGGKEIAGYI